MTGMRLLYDLGIRLYHLLILCASLFNVKARKWIRGRKDLFSELSSGIDPGFKYIWFHCSSLGEFEQGRPVIEAIRREKPGTRILLTFFSPSGYEIRKNYAEADLICYLPLDTRRNARKFLDIIAVEQAYFVKYEFWYHFILELKQRSIPLYLISAIFRKNQVFFKGYGGWFRKMLLSFDHIFVQDEESRQLLSNRNITHVSISGDSRFDRVFEISEKVRNIPGLESFAGSGPTLVAGSTWPADEDLLCRYINESDRPLKWILVPHEIHASHIQRLKGNLTKETLIYSETGESDSMDAPVLIIDTIGLLSSLYRYGNLAYIGGGFGKGIHNTLEAATFGLPVVFGPRFHKFMEAKDLIQAGAGYPVQNYSDLKDILNRLFDDPAMLKTSGKSARDYVFSKLGASRMIVKSTFKS